MQGDCKEIRKKKLDRIVGSVCTLVIHNNLGGEGLEPKSSRPA